MEWNHRKAFGEVWRRGSGHVVVDVLLGLHHRCQVQQRGDSNDLLGVPSDLKSSQDGAEGRERLSFYFVQRRQLRTYLKFLVT